MHRLKRYSYSLTPADHFNLLLFNQDVSTFSPQPIATDPAAIQRALDYVHASRLRGGTDLGKALTAGLAQATLPNSSLILLTDGGSDRGATVLVHKISATTLSSGSSRDNILGHMCWRWATMRTCRCCS